VQEAHRFGLPITAHAHASAAVWNVVNAGFDSIEHGSFVSENGVDARPEIVEALSRSGIMVSATIGTLPGSTLPGHIAAQVPAFIELFAQLTQAGVVMVCSTDAGIGPSRPHNVLPYAVVMLVETHGWPAADALRAATSLPARLCRVEDRKGRLAGGFDADIL